MHVQEASSADTAHGRMLSLWTDTTASHTDTDTATAPHNGSQNMPAVRAAVADVSGKGPVRVLEGTSGAHVSTLPHEDNIQVNRDAIEHTSTTSMYIHASPTGMPFVPLCLATFVNAE